MPLTVTELESNGFKIEHVDVYPSKNQLVIAGDPVQVTPKMMAVLCRLAANQGKVISKDRLIQDVWGNVSVSELVLSRAIADLRKTLGETARQPQFIQTISKKGYCLLKPVKLIPAEKNTQALQSSLFRMWHWPISIGLTIITAIGFVYVLNNKTSNNEILINRQAHHLTSNEQVTEFHPRFSHSGDKTAYIEVTDSFHSKLVVTSLTTKNKRIITEYRGIIRAPAFSPKDQSIAYFELSREECRLVIRELSQLEETHQFPCPKSTSRALDWSPDGLKLLTTRFEPKNSIEELITIDINSKQTRLVAAPEKKQSGLLFPRYSPSGNKIAALYYEPSANLWAIAIVDASNGNFDLLHDENNFLNQVVWGQTESSLYYAVASGEKAGVWLLNLRTKETTPILNSDPVDLDFNAKSNSFVVTEERRDIDIWSYDITTQKHQKLTATSKIERLPTLSPDKQFLAYISNQNSGFNIWIKDQKSGTSTQLTQFNTGIINDLRWHPIKKEIYFTYAVHGENSIRKVDLDAQSSVLFEQHNNYRFLDWSPNGQKLYYLSDSLDGQWRVFELDNLGQSIRQITGFPVAQLRANSAAVYFQRNDSNAIFRVTLNDPDLSVVQLTEIPVSVLAWDLSQDALIISSLTKTGKANFLSYRLDDGQTGIITTANVAVGRQDKYVSVTKHNEYLFYTNLEHRQRDIILYAPQRQ